MLTVVYRMYLFLMQVRPWLFDAQASHSPSPLQMVQLPMMFIGKLPIVKRNKTLGNVVFWLGLMCGFPLL